MPINQSIIDQMKSSEDELQLETEHPLPALPTLRGSEKQIKYAQSIRATALALSGWTRATVAKLCRIVDSTWWIANKTITTTMKFKEPSPGQMLITWEEPDDDAGYEPRPYPEEPRPSEKRLGDAAAFAASASASPRLAEAAIIAVLSRLYRDEMRDGLRKRAKQLVDQFETDTARDIAAIRKMIE